MFELQLPQTKMLSVSLYIVLLLQMQMASKTLPSLKWKYSLNNLMLLKHEIFLTGEINFHLNCKTSTGTKSFLSTLD